MSSVASNREYGRPDRPPAIVIGLDSMQGIQTVRSLKRNGVDVIAIASDPDHHCCRTNSCRDIYFAGTQTEEFLPVLEQIAERSASKPVLYPCHDETVRILARNREALDDKFRINISDRETIELLSDKVRFYRFAQEHGLPVTPTRIIESDEDASAAATQLRFPAVLKPAARTLEWDRNTMLKAYKVENAAEFMAVYQRCKGWARALILQEWIEGRDDSLFSCNCYFSTEGEPLCTFVARKLRQWPPQVGVSSLGEEVRNDFVLEQTLRLFRSFGFRGLGYVEFKRDSRDGKYYLVEPNVGRPTGRSGIAEAGGVELLYTMYCDILGHALPEARIQRYVGTKWVDLRHDFQSALYYWRKGEITLSDWYRSWRGPKAHTYFSWKDPGPFIFDLAAIPKRIFSRAGLRKREYLRPVRRSGRH